MIRHRLGRAAFGVLAWGLVTSCGAGGTGRPPAVAVAASSAEPAPPTPTEPGHARTTPGAISCGATRCDLATEVCCADSTGDGLRCAPRPPVGGELPCGADEIAKLCDENADCGAGSVCCSVFPCTGGCPQTYDCEKTRCGSDPGEICLRGGTCGAGFVCRADERHEQGSCALGSPGVDCRGTRCDGATPVCRWDPRKNEAKCVPPDDGPGETDTERTWLACASAKDCGGYACGKMADMPMRVFHCSGPGFAGDRYWPLLCASVSDCPPHWGKSATGCQAPAQDEAPSFTKVCVYPED